MRYNGKDMEFTIGGVKIQLKSIEYGDVAPPRPIDRTPGVYVVDNVRLIFPRRGPRYPGKGNRLARRTAAKGKVRK